MKKDIIRPQDELTIESNSSRKQEKPKSVLFLSENCGHGHIRVAQAIMSALRIEEPYIETNLISTLHPFHPAFDRIWCEEYEQIFSEMPGLEDCIKPTFNTSSNLIRFGFTWIREVGNE